MQAVPGSPFRVHVMAGSVCPGKCMAVGEGIGRSGTVSSGQLMQFTVQLCDAFGNPVRRPAAKEVQCAIETGSWSIPSEVKDNGDGTYTVSYLPDLALAPTAKDEAVQQVLKAAATVLRLDVTVDGEPIQWSPFYQGVSPIGVDPTLCTLLDVPQQINAGETHKIVLQSVNKDGVELDSGGAVFHVSLTGHPEAIADIRDDNNGQYSIRVLAKAVGHYDLELSIKSGGAHVMRSPIRLSVVPPGLFKSGFWTGARTMDEAAANNFVMSGTGLTHAVAGVEAGFEIASRRADEQTPASSFLVEFRPAGHDGDVVYGEVTGPVKGVYSCRYRLYTSGQYSLIVKLAKFTLKGCPKVVDVEPNVTSAERCKVYGEGLSREVTRDAEHTFFVETLDAHGNPTWHRQDRIDVEIRGGKLDVFKRKGVMRARFRKAVVKADVERVEDNVYKCSYRVPQHGWYGIILKHQRSGEGDWAPMGDSPYEVEVVRPAVAQSTWSATTAADKGAVIQGLSVSGMLSVGCHQKGAMSAMPMCFFPLTCRSSVFQVACPPSKLDELCAIKGRSSFPFVL